MAMMIVFCLDFGCLPVKLSNRSNQPRWSKCSLSHVWGLIWVMRSKSTPLPHLNYKWEILSPKTLSSISRTYKWEISRFENNRIDVDISARNHPLLLLSNLRSWLIVLRETCPKVWENGRLSPCVLFQSQRRRVQAFYYSCYTESYMSPWNLLRGLLDHNPNRFKMNVISSSDIS